jgi:hypothetical protein
MPQRTSDLVDSLDKRPKLKKMDMRFGTRNVRCLYRAGSLITVAKDMSKYKLYLVGVQKVRWDRGETEPAGEYTCFYGKGSENHELDTGSFFFVRKRIISRSRDSSVGIATGYGLDDWGVGVRVPVASRIFSSARRPDRLWGPPNPLSNGYRGHFPRG